MSLVNRHNRVLLAAALALVVTPGFDGGTARAQSRETVSSLAGQMQLFQSRIVSGRITAVGPASRQHVTSNVTRNERSERLSIDLGNGQPAISYERTVPDERISIDIDSENEVVIQRLPRSASDRPTVRFVQPHEGPIQLTVAINDRSETYLAASLWHLLLAEPALCREHLLPLLEILRPTWDIARQAQQVEAALCRVDPARASVDRAAWHDSVQALGSARFVERERAERRLLAVGPVIVPFLEQQEQGQLDAEQLFRMRRIAYNLSELGDEDAPERVATSMAADPRVWYSLARREDAAVRRVSAMRLKRLLNAPFEFDPDEEPVARARQLARLREKFKDLFDPPPPADEAPE